MAVQYLRVLITVSSKPTVSTPYLADFTMVMAPLTSFKSPHRQLYYWCRSLISPVTRRL